MTTDEIVSFSDWKHEMLLRRGLSEPDGRSLYQYRVTDDEFVDLEQFLRSKIEQIGWQGMPYVGRRRAFPSLFVLYGAEWWRRRYNGSGFAWEPILDGVGIDHGSWNQASRSECVLDGFREWGLRFTQTSGFRFLGGVAVQGGLPLCLLAEARGGIGSLISRVLRLARNTSVSKPNLQSWVESLEGLLPKSFRQPAIFTLLTDVAWTVLSLKQKADLTSGVGAVEILNRRFPDWREMFPLPIEDAHARGLIEQLVREAASIKIEKYKVALPVERTLEKGEFGDWTLRSNLDLPEVIDVKALKDVFKGLNEDDLPRTADLALISGEKERVTSLRKMVGQDSYRVARTPWGFSGETALEEHLLKLTAIDGRVWSAPAPKGEHLDDELPWLFGDTEEPPKLIKQGGGSVADHQGFVAVPIGWVVEGRSGQPIEASGRIREPERAVYAFDVPINASDRAGNTYRIDPGKAGATGETYVLYGERQWEGFVSPPLAFKGMPKLFCVDEEGTSKRINGNVSCTVIGAPKSTLPLGPVQFRYPAQGEIKHRSRLLLLPPEAELKFLPRDAVSGDIYFSGWHLADAEVFTDGVESKCASLDGSLLLEVTAADGERAPDAVDINVRWRHTTSHARLRLPFPAKGVRGFIGSGQELRHEESIAVQELTGSRLVIVGADQYSRKLLRLKANNQEIFRVHPVKCAPDAFSVEIRPSDYRSEIEQLLTIDDNPDSTVSLVVELDGRIAFKLTVLPHKYKLQRENTSVWINLAKTDSGDGETPRANAIRLETPGEEPIELQLIDSESDSRIEWSFDPTDREAGSWLIYPPRDSRFYFRPTLRTVAGECGVENAYSSAISIAGQEKRLAALDELVAELAGDFDHPQWSQVEQLAGQIGHLPLATVDLWRRFCRSSRGMAALALRYGSLSSHFLYRFGQELPFAWETVSYGSWRDAAGMSASHCEKIFGAALCGDIFKDFLASRLADLSAEVGALWYVFGVVRAAYFSDAKVDCEQLRAGGPYIADWLFRYQDSPLMKLRRTHMDDSEWPTNLQNLVSSALRDQNSSRYLHPDRLGFQDSAINIPLLLAAQCGSDTTEDWFRDPSRIHALRQYRAFDPDWYDEAFNQTIGRCLADGLFDKDRQS